MWYLVNKARCALGNACRTSCMVLRLVIAGAVAMALSVVPKSARGKSTVKKNYPSHQPGKRTKCGATGTSATSASPIPAQIATATPVERVQISGGRLDS